jgi:hypothetical protein
MKEYMVTAAAPDQANNHQAGLVWPETRLIHSVESLLTWRQAADIVRSTRAALAGRETEFEVGSRGRSVHEIEGVPLATVTDTYEPCGRIEYDELGRDVTGLLDEAVRRRLDDIRIAFPSVTRASGWFYVEYGPGQFVTPHVDYPVDDDFPDHVKYAAIGVVLHEPDAGGEFFVETAGSQEPWACGRVRPGANMHSGWFAGMRRTRWRTSSRVGDALCWGTQVTHGTEPVLRGRAAKVIALLH